MQIVLARLEDETVIAELGNIDLGRPHRFKTVKRPIAAMWLNNGNEKDAENARVYANRQGDGWQVFTYQKEADPLACAKRDIQS